MLLGQRDAAQMTRGDLARIGEAAKAIAQLRDTFAAAGLSCPAEN